MTQICIDPRVLGDAWVPGQRVVLGTDGIFVVASGDITTEGLRALFDAEPGFQVLGQAASLERARIEVGRLRPTLLVIDLTGAPVGAAETAWAWQMAYPQMGLLLLAHEPDPALVRAVRDAQASGLVLMSSPAETVRAAVRAVSAGLTFVDAQLGHELDALALEDACATTVTVSRAERRVLERLADGLSNRDIGRELGISEHTVKSHLANLTRKLGCRDRVHAAALAIQLGLV